MSDPNPEYFNRTYLHAPIADVLNYGLAYICHGIAIGHVSYTKHHRIESFNKLHLRLPEAPDDIFYGELDAFLTLISVKAAQKCRPSHEKESLFDAIIDLEVMSSRGHNIKIDEIRKMLQKTVKRGFRSRRGYMRVGDADRLKTLSDRLPSRLQRSLCQSCFCSIFPQSELAHKS